MNKLQYVKFDKFFINQNQTMQAIASAISKLNANLPSAIAHQAYVLTNVDDNMDESIKMSISKRVDELEVQFMKVVEMITDISSTKASTMTVEELMSKYSVSMEQYSNDLE
jgi:hypothetical protein